MSPRDHASTAAPRGPVLALTVVLVVVLAAAAVLGVRPTVSSISSSSSVAPFSTLTSATSTSSTAPQATGNGSSSSQVALPPAAVANYTTTSCTVTGQPSGMLVRAVTDTSNSPIENVTVNSVHTTDCGIFQVDTTTNASGIAALDPTDGGNYSLTMLYRGYSVYGYLVKLYPAESTYVTVSLPSENVSVVDCSNGADPWSGSAPPSECHPDTSNLLSLPYSLVSGLFSAHLRSVGALNASGTVSGYEFNATLVFGGPGGPATGFNGTHRGQSEIESLFSGFLSQFRSLSVENSTYSQADYQSYVTVSAEVGLTGALTGGGQVSAQAILKTVYSYTGGGWTISYEVWTFASYSA